MVAPPSDVADVFISYRHTDHEVAATLARGLEQRGFRVWFDATQIRPGAHWQDRIEDAALSARACIVLVGASGVDRVQADEVRLVLGRTYGDPDLPIIPVRLPGAQSGFALDGFLQMRSHIELPPTGPDDAVLDQLAAAVQGLATPEPVQKPSAETPYPGIRRFRQADAPYFFGRSDEIQALRQLAIEPGLLAVIGPSGAGKSSLVRAGLLPALAAQRSPGWDVVVIEPDAEPVRSLAIAVVSAGDASTDPSVASSTRIDEIQRVADAIAARPSSLSDYFAARFASHAGEKHLLLFVDQLEQVFARCKDSARREQFFANLTELVVRGPSQTHVVVTIRSDFLGELTGYRELGSAITERHLLLGPLSLAGLRDAVQRPAWAAGVRLERMLVDRVVADVQDQPNALPLLAVALEAMWEHRRGDLLTLAAYEQGGGVRGALAQRAERAVAPFLAQQESLVRTTLLRLVHVTEGGGATRERLLTEDLIPADGQRAAATRAVLGALVDVRLAVMDRDEATGQPTVELSHDAIIAGWDRLAGWIIEARQREAPRRRLADAARTWQTNGRSRAFLATPGLLDESTGAIDDGYISPTSIERDFLSASRAQAFRRKTVAWTALSAALLAVIAIAVTTYFIRQGNEARRAADAARAQRMAADAVRQGAERPDIALLLGVEANVRADIPTTRSSLAAALAAPAQVTRMRALNTNLTQAVLADRDILVAATDGAVSICADASPSCRQWSPAGAASVRSIALSDDASAGAVVRADGSVAAGPLRMPPVKLPVGDVTAVAFAGSGAPNLLFYGDVNGQIGVIDLSTGTTNTLGRQPDAVGLLAVDPTLNWILTTNERTRGFNLTRIGASAQRIPVAGELGRVYAAAFSIDGSQVVVGEGDRNDVVAWNVDRLVQAPDASPDLRLAGHTRTVTSLTLTADEIFSGDAGGTVRRWSLARATEAGPRMTAVPSLESQGADASVLAVGVIDDEVMSVRGDGVVIEWDREGRSALALGASTLPTARAVATNGSLSAAGDADGNLVVAAMSGDQENGDPGTGPGPAARTARSGITDTRAIALSDNGRLLVVAGKGAALLDTASAQILARLPDDGVTITAAAFLDGGRFVVLGKADGAVSVLDDTLAPRSTLPPSNGSGPISALAVSPRGPIAFARGTEIHVVPPDLEGVLAVLADHTAEVASLAFSASGDVLASGSDDRTIILWSTTSWQGQRTLVGHSDKVTGLGFPGSTGVLVSSSQDGTLRLWDEHFGTGLGLPLRWGSNTVDALATSPRGPAVLSLTGDELVTWQLTPATWGSLACQIAGRQLNEDEWRVYVGSVRYEPACQPAGGG